MWLLYIQLLGGHNRYA